VIVRGEVNPKVSYWLSGFTSDFRRLGNHSRWNFNFTPFTQEIRKRPQGLIHFIDGQETTPASFRGQFDSIVINGYMAAARSFLSTYLRETPPTVFQGSGAKSTRFYGELEEIRTKLSSGSDLERVKILIQEFIDGLESGLLKVEDRRPAP
jgi:hypothetical protein